jgi:hypothetical protein
MTRTPDPHARDGGGPAGSSRRPVAAHVPAAMGGRDCHPTGVLGLLPGSCEPPLFWFGKYPLSHSGVRGARGVGGRGERDAGSRTAPARGHGRPKQAQDVRVERPDGCRVRLFSGAVREPAVVPAWGPMTGRRLSDSDPAAGRPPARDPGRAGTHFDQGREAGCAKDAADRPPLLRPRRPPSLARPAFSSRPRHPLAGGPSAE